MRLNIGRKASDKIKSILMSIISFVMVLGSVSFAVPLFFSQIVSAAAPTLVQADQNDPDTVWHTQDTTPTLTGSTIGATTVTVTVNSFVCISPVVSSGWSCDGSFITTPLTPNVLYSIRMEATNIDGSIVTTDLTGVIVDTIGPVISERNAVPTRTSDNTPQYDFNTDSYGVITFAGGCSSGQTTAYDPSQRLDFSTLSDGLYDSCTIYTTDSAGNQSNTINVSAFTVDTTGPSFNPLGFKSWSNLDSTEVAVSGNLSDGWNLERDGLATTDYYLDFSDSTIADGNLDVDYHPLTLIDYTGGLQGTALIQYYNDRGVPAPFLQYLSDAAVANEPFAYIKTDGTNHPMLIDAAKHDLLSVDVPMTIPGDFPEGEYNVSGRIADDLENEAILDYKLIVGDITAPVLTESTPVPTLTNNSTPSYSFTSSEAGDISYIGSCSSSTSVAVAGNNTIVLNELANGVYDDCQITVTDDSGNTSLALDIADFEVDVSAPVTTLTLTGGTLGSNGWYKGPTAPILTLSTEAAATIWWQWENEGWYSGSTDQTPVVTRGIRTLEYYSIDAATNTEMPHQTSVVKYDRAAPTGTVTINDGDAWTNSTSVMLSLDALDALSGVDKVMVKNGADATWSGPYDYSSVINWTLNSNEGNKRVDVKYIDVAGNEMATAVSDTIKLDMTAPTVTGLEVVDTTSLPFVNHNPFVMGDAINRVRADVTDSLSGIDTDSCEYTLDGGLNWLSGVYNSTTHRCIADLSTMTDGSPLLVNVKVSDVAGNEGMASDLSLTVDSEGPVNGSMVFEPYYQDTMAGQVNMTVPMSDTSSGMANCEFRYYFDGSYSDWVGGYWNSAHQSCEINFGGMENGRVYELQMRGVDEIGHYGEIVSSGYKVVDSEAPDVEYVDPTPTDGTITGQNNQTFMINVDENVGVESCLLDLGLGYGDFETGTLDGWSTGGTEPWRISTDAMEGTYSAQSGNLLWRNNVNSWISREVDVPINTNITFRQKVSSEGGWDYLNFYIDGNAYSSISGSRDWHQVSFPILAGHHTIMWNYTKDFSVTSGLDSGFIDDIQIGGVNLGLVNQFMIDNGDGTWSSGPVDLPEGYRTYTTTCVDRVGNTTTTEVRSLTVDTTAPTTPGVPVDNQDNPTNNKLVTWTWSASSDLYSGVDHYDWYIEKDGAYFAKNQAAGDTTSKTKWLVDDGEYVFYVSAVDGLGNASNYAASEALVLDTANPEVPTIISPEDGFASNDSYPLLDWSDVNDAAKYRFQICYNDPDADGFCDEERKVTVNDSQRELVNELVEGDYWWRVRAIDDAGNLSLWSEANKLIIDQTDPTSSADSLSEYTNKVKFNINITSADLQNLLQKFVGKIGGLQGSGVKYIELWYKKDDHVCPIVEADTFSVLGFRPLDCVDGYVRYGGEFDPLLPIEFDSSLTGGDGHYEFFSVAVDNAGNREEMPGSAVQTLTFIINETETEILPDTSTIVDTKAPIITLKGEATLSLTVGGLYAELGAVADDGSSVSINGAVNTAVAGTYTITYTSTDAAGNVAVPVTRTVTVSAAPAIFSTSGGEVLGDTTTEPPVDEVKGDEAGEVKGTSDKKDDFNWLQDAEMLGIAWYWWLIGGLAAAGIGWWFIAGFRRRSNDS